MTSKARTYALFTLILLLGAALRIIHIDQQSIWVDEGLAWYHANQPDLLLSLSRDTHPPLYFAGLRLWQELTGQSELALRFFSVVPSMLSIALVTHLARELRRLRGGPAAIIPLAALFMALADAEIYLAQEVRHYTWHVLFAIGSAWAFLRWLRTQEGRWWGLWIAFTTLLVYTHYIGAFTGVAQGLYALLFLRGRRRVQAIGGLIVSALLLAPWLLLVGTRQVGNSGANWSFEPSLALLEDVRGRWFGAMWPLTMGLALLGAVSIHYLPGRWRVKGRPFGPAFLLLAWIVVPLALGYLVNAFIPILSPRRFSQITPAVALLTAFGLGNLRSPARGFLVAVLIVYGVSYVDFGRYEPEWRDVAALTTRYALPGDLTLTDIDGGDYQLQYYYRQQLRPGVDYRSLKTWRDFSGETYNQLPALLASYETIWLLHWSSDYQVFGALDQRGFAQTALQTVEHIGSILRVYRYDRVPPRDAAVAAYENGMVLRWARIDEAGLRVDLLWSADENLNVAYTTSAFLLDAAGQLVAQADSIPFAGARPTTDWQPGEVIYDPKALQLQGLEALPAGRYSVGVQVYRFTPEGTQRALTASGEQWAIIGALERR